MKRVLYKTDSNKSLKCFRNPMDKIMEIATTRYLSDNYNGNGNELLF